MANRKAFDEALATYTGVAASGANDLCLLLIDIDHFKRFNDTLGHIVGNEVLKFVTRRSTLRRVPEETEWQQSLMYRLPDKVSLL